MSILARASVSAHILPLLLAIGLTAPCARADTFVDDFNSNHDYSGKNVAGTIWDGVLFNAGFSGTQNTTVVWANANSTNTGRFTLASSSGDWGGANDDGFLLFRTVSGDFTATIQVISATAPNYHDFGLMARAAEYAEGGPGEDYVAARYFAPGGGNHFRSVDNDVETNYDSSGLHSFLKLNRTGNLFTYTRADDSAFTLNTVTTGITRSDLDGLSLQVGIWQATYTGNLGTAVLDNFTLITVPEPSTAWLAVCGALAFLRRPHRIEERRSERSRHQSGPI